MAKKSMKLKYKTQKRERNKQPEKTTRDETLDVLKNILGILVFLGVAYLCMWGMTKLGLFEKGYTAPEAKEVTVDTDFISIGSVFNRKDTTYYVIFDDYQDTYKKNAYVDTLLKNRDDMKVYKVDMGQNENKKFLSDEENKNAKTASELKIKGITLIKINKGKIEKYISGSEDIEKFLSK